LQQKISTRERLVAAARQLFSERGFHRTAMADLADHAQVSVGTIYRSFSSKSEIVRAIVEADTQDTLERLRSNIDKVRDGEIAGETAIEQLISEWVCTQHDALGHEIVAEAHRNPEIAEIISEISGQFRELFRILAKILRPDMGEAEIEGVSEILLACLFGMGNRDFTQPHLCEQATAAVVAKLILRSVHTSPSA
jgi:TetR/AcrR family transcriptional regulator, repressor for uid operon